MEALQELFNALYGYVLINVVAQIVPQLALSTLLLSITSLVLLWAAPNAALGELPQRKKLKLTFMAFPVWGIFSLYGSISILRLRSTDNASQPPPPIAAS